MNPDVALAHAFTAGPTAHPHVAAQVRTVQLARQDRRARIRRSLRLTARG